MELVSHVLHTAEWTGLWLHGALAATHWKRGRTKEETASLWTVGETGGQKGTRGHGERAYKVSSK